MTKKIEWEDKYSAIFVGADLSSQNNTDLSCFAVVERKEHEIEFHYIGHNENKCYEIYSSLKEKEKDNFYKKQNRFE